MIKTTTISAPSFLNASVRTDRSKVSSSQLNGRWEKKFWYFYVVTQRINEFMHGRVEFDALFIITSDRAEEETEILTLKRFSTVRTPSERPFYFLTRIKDVSGALLCWAWSRQREGGNIRSGIMQKQKDVRVTKDKDWGEESFRSRSEAAGMCIMLHVACTVERYRIWKAGRGI